MVCILLEKLESGCRYEQYKKKGLSFQFGLIFNSLIFWSAKKKVSVKRETWKIERISTQLPPSCKGTR